MKSQKPRCDQHTKMHQFKSTDPLAKRKMHSSTVSSHLLDRPMPCRLRAASRVTKYGTFLASYGRKLGERSRVQT
jgi:hypothetical protein